MKLKGQFIALILAVVASTATAADGVIVKSKNKDLENNKETDATVYISSNKAIILTSGDSGSRILFDATTEVFTYVDDKKKEYYQFDKATITQLKQQIQMFAQMMKQFASQMPAEQRKKLDPLLNPGSTSAVTYRKVSDGKIKSWNTTTYEANQDGKVVAEVNIANYQTLGVDAGKFGVMKKMLSFAKDNLKEVAALLPAGASLSQFSVDQDSPILRDGLPVKTIAFQNGVAKNENIVESVVLASIADSQFSIPSGYARKTVDVQNLGR